MKNLKGYFETQELRKLKTYFKSGCQIVFEKKKPLNLIKQKTRTAFLIKEIVIVE